MQIITTHKGTDFDALASVVAAKIIYPDAVGVIPRNVNANVKAFLSLHKDVLNLYEVNEIDLDEVTSLIVVDTNSWDRLEGMKKLKNRDDLEVILWDHHEEKDIVTDRKVQKEVGATVTLLIRELEKDRKILTRIQATLFLCGIYEDTGNLTFPGATGADAYAAGYLLDRKADLDVVNSFLKPAYGTKQKNTLFDMLKSSEVKEINGHRIGISKIDVSGHITGLSVVVNMYRDIVNVDAAFGIFNDSERKKCMIIGRSATDELDISTIMNSMGGGGHPRAGSALLKGGNPEEAEERILDLIAGNQQSSIQLSDIMSYPVFTVESTTPMDDVGKTLKSKGCTGLPVVENGRIVGVISRRDFSRVKKDKQRNSPVKAFMSRDIVTIDPKKSPLEAAKIMIGKDIGRIPVVEEGEVIGIVTRTDVMVYFYDLLPD